MRCPAFPLFVWGEHPLVSVQVILCSALSVVLALIGLVSVYIEGWEGYIHDYFNNVIDMH